MRETEFSSFPSSKNCVTLCQETTSFEAWVISLVWKLKANLDEMPSNKSMFLSLVEKCRADSVCNSKSHLDTLQRGTPGRTAKSSASTRTHRFLVAGAPAQFLHLRSIMIAVLLIFFCSLSNGGHFTAGHRFKIIKAKFVVIWFSLKKKSF